MQENPVLIDNFFEIEEIPTEPAAVSEEINEAIAEAERIVAQAEKTAAQCLDEAHKEAALLKQQAHDEGQQQGYQAGQQDGYQAGLQQGRQDGKAEMEQVIADAIAKAQQMLDASQQDAKEMILGAERQIVDIALTVARKIIAYEVAENPMVVLPLVKAALQKVSDQEEVVIRVSADDFDSVLMAKKDLQAMVGREHALKIIVDHTIDSGSCIIDTSYGAVDARLDTQFETIKKALQGVA